MKYEVEAESKCLAGELGVSSLTQRSLVKSETCGTSSLCQRTVGDDRYLEISVYVNVQGHFLYIHRLIAMVEKAFQPAQTIRAQAKKSKGPPQTGGNKQADRTVTKAVLANPLIVPW